MKNIDKVAKFYDKEGYICIRIYGLDTLLDVAGLDELEGVDVKPEDIKGILFVYDSAFYEYGDVDKILVFVYFTNNKSAKEFADDIQEEIDENMVYERRGKVVCFGQESILNELD